MENSEVNQSLLPDKIQQDKPVYSTEEIKRLADFFAVLIDIDRRENVTKFYDKPIK